MTSRRWVVGAGGLLGSAVVRHLGTSGEDVFTAEIGWNSTGASSELDAALDTFLGTDASAPWTIYWCAGAATTSADAAAFTRENTVFEAFIDRLAALSPAMQRVGTLFFASSAGALFAGATGAPFSELSAVAPLGLYGAAKLGHELRVTRLAAETGIRVAVGRIANLYGPGQSLAKQQGLVSRLCIATLTRVPLSVFVSIDTIRDYLYIDECAELVVRLGDRAGRLATGSVTKILASGRPTTIGSLIGVLGQVAGRRPLVVWGQSAESGLQSSDLRFESVVLPDLIAPQAVNLTDGIARTLEDLRRSLASR
jgi:UDP-glucose 4-epimerase